MVVLFAALCASAPAAAQPSVDPSVELAARPAWLGVAMDAGGDVGVRVEHVVRGSPADRAGLKTGDRIVAIDGSPVTLPAHVSRGVGAHRVGETVTVAVERQGTPVSAPVVLSSRPTLDEMLRMDLVGLPAPSFKEVSPLAGAPRTLEALRGHVVVLDFWAAWCGPCRALAPRLSALKDRFGAQGLSVVGVTTDEASSAAIFAERHQMRYPSVVDDDARTSKTYGVTSLPTMVVIDKRGVVRDVFVGVDASVLAKLEARIKTLLSESASRPSR